MSRRLALFAALLLAGPCVHADETVPPPVAAKPEDAATPEQAAEVFRRAFWRNPAPEDRILHALRHEEKDEAGRVVRWSWWLAVEPGDAFRDWLLRENPFSLVPVNGGEAPPDAPTWFPAAAALAGFARHHVPSGRLQVFVDPATGRLYATDAGGGFAVLLKKE